MQLLLEIGLGAVPNGILAVDVEIPTLCEIGKVKKHISQNRKVQSLIKNQRLAFSRWLSFVNSQSSIINSKSKRQFH